MTFWCGSWHFRHWLSRGQQKTNIFKKSCSAYYFLKVYLNHFSKINHQKEVTKQLNQGFSYYFCLMIEGSGSGSIPLTNRSGSRRPKKKVIKKWQNSRNSGFSYYFCLFIEGSVPCTNGSGSGIQEAQKHADPDPQDWYLAIPFITSMPLVCISIIFSR